MANITKFVGNPANFVMLLIQETLADRKQEYGQLCQPRWANLVGRAGRA